MRSHLEIEKKKFQAYKRSGTTHRSVAVVLEILTIFKGFGVFQGKAQRLIDLLVVNQRTLSRSTRLHFFREVSSAVLVSQDLLVTDTWAVILVTCAPAHSIPAK